MARFDPSLVLTVDEVRAVTAAAEELPGVRGCYLRAVWSLAVGAGLRSSECCKLQMRDLNLAMPRPAINIRPVIAKRKRGRTVPLWWSPEMLPALVAWRECRESVNAKATDLFLASPDHRNWMGPITRQRIWEHFKRLVSVLGPERQRKLRHHSGRHTFASHALSSGRSIIQVADALGHASIETTGVYLHAIEREGLPTLYGDPGGDARAELARVHAATQPKPGPDGYRAEELVALVSDETPAPGNHR